MRTNRELCPPYARLASAMLRAATTSRMGTYNAGSAERSLNLAVREHPMDTEDEADPLLVEILHHLQKAGMGFRRLAQALSDDELSYEWSLMQAQKVFDIADYMDPPKPERIDNVVLFVPRARG